MTQNVKLPAKAQALADYATSKGLLVTVDSQEETLASTGSTYRWFHVTVKRPIGDAPEDSALAMIRRYERLSVSWFRRAGDAKASKLGMAKWYQYTQSHELDGYLRIYSVVDTLAVGI